MSFSTGKNFKITVFGTSHGDCTGITCEGIPAGYKIDTEFINREIARRKSTDRNSTQRQEKDSFKIISGIFENRTDGGPVTAVFPNRDTKSEDYDRYIFRPGHADYTAYIKYKGFSDYRGGGFFSGRMTLPLVFAGTLAKQYLKEKNIEIFSHILSVKNEKEISFGELFGNFHSERDTDSRKQKILTELSSASFPCIEKETQFRNIIENTENDSVGGICEIMVLGMPPGVGEPFFDSMESVLSKLYFSVPGIKGIEFGEGFAITEMTGSEANDRMEYREGTVTFLSNHSGGISGGISNGMPVICRAAVRPTPTVSKEQKTVNADTKENVLYKGRGRHDKAIILRISPIMEAVTAIGLLDLILPVAANIPCSEQQQNHPNKNTVENNTSLRKKEIIFLHTSNKHSATEETQKNTEKLFKEIEKFSKNSR